MMTMVIKMMLAVKVMTDDDDGDDEVDDDDDINVGGQLWTQGVCTGLTPGRNTH